LDTQQDEGSWWPSAQFVFDTFVFVADAAFSKGAASL
jgi:hypothetical protein